MSAYQFSPFEIGQIKAHVHHGLTAAAIARILVKRDGKSHWSDKAVQVQVAKLRRNPKWRGERQEGSRRPRKTTLSQDRQIVSLLMKKRGKKKVTVQFLKQRFHWARSLSNTAVEERLHAAGLAYLRRRRKSLVPEKYIIPRIHYSEAIKRKHQSTLDQWAYSDGTVVYLDRDLQEHESTQQAALGSHIWKMADGSDAMYKDCIGPSSYAKAQGLPVRIWGLLVPGRLNIHILDEGEVMNRYLYAELIEEYFPEWLGHCCYLVQDFEKCLHCEEPLAALKDIGVELVEGYPKCSQDFNAIENAWKLLRERLYDTLPKSLETREQFIRRLRAAVAWLNLRKRDELWYLATNQKERATDCLRMNPKGSRTRW